MNESPMVQLLLKFKADPNDTQIGNESLLFDALTETNILEALLDAGAKVDAIESGDVRATPLAVAAYQNKVSAVEILLKHGANPNVRNPDGYTPLHLAAIQLADRKIFELLLDHHANPNVRNNQGKTPLDYLKEKIASASPAAQSTASQLAELLRQHGALDVLPDWDRITVSRPSANFSIG